MFEEKDETYKAKILLEALPYIQKFQQTIFVVKYGGSFLEDPDLSIQKRVAKDLVLLAAVGIHVVIVHGGGKAISRNMQKAGIETSFVNGLRYTGQDTVRIVEETLNEEINPEICALLKEQGGNPLGFKGNDLLQCDRHYEVNKDGDRIDYGYVGNIKEVDTFPVRKAFSKNVIPVISPVALDENGQSYNTNADSAAAEIAIALRSKRLFYLCDTPGLLSDLNDENTLMSTLHINDVEQLKKMGVIAEGMLPKVNSAIKAVRENVQRVHFIGGRIAHSLLLEIFTDKGIGTEIVL